MTTTVASSRLADVFATAKAEHRLAFMPFVTAGDPDLETTLDVISELAAQGVDLIEVGVPYSDPIADGPVIQASYTRALEGGFKLEQFFRAFEGVQRGERAVGKEEGDTTGRSLAPSRLPPLVAMVSYSIVYRYGTDQFVARCGRAGFAGLIVPDLPGDEAGEFAASVKRGGLDLIELVSPLTPAKRVERILDNCTGFVYCIAVAGTTGEREALPAALTEQLARLREKTNLPLAVGFGVSRPEHVGMLRGKADGVIVGSAIVRRFERFSNEPRQQVIREIGEYAAGMVSACQ
jgi:tryptophan synthase alpha chain